MKKFNSQYIDTLWFNLAFIWVLNLFFAVTLQFDVLRKIITYFDGIRTRKSERKQK